MQFSLKMEGGPADICGPDDGQFVVALRQMVKKEIEVMIVPVMEDLVRKIVKEEIQLAEERFSTRNHANELTNPRERDLTLKFYDEVSDPLLTGKSIEAKGSTHVRVALVEKSTGKVVNCGPESSAKVEILLLDGIGDDNEHRTLSHEDFDRMIIREGDKKKPHFAKSNYIYLDEGIGILRNTKLGHSSNWMKSCKCRLGARLVGSFVGVNVQEATTGSFLVLDSRSKLYEKHHPPYLSDHVWRLVNIGRDGPICTRLKENNIITVQDFLFLHTVDPQRLKKIVRAGAKWKATVDHALACGDINYERIYLYYPSSSESRMCVTFNVVGELKGLIHGPHHVPVSNLSDDDKDRAHELLLTAFENKKDITSFHDENSLLSRFPLRPNDASELDPSYESWFLHNDASTVSPLDPWFDPSQEYFGNDGSLMSLCFPDGGGSNSHEQVNAANKSNLVNVASVICVIWSSQRFMASRGVRGWKKQKI